MQESAHRFVAGVWFSGLEVLHKSLRFFFGRRSLEEAPADKIDQFPRFFPKLRGRELTDVDRIALDLLGQLRGGAITGIGAFNSLLRVHRHDGVAVNRSEEHTSELQSPMYLVC